jgi:hypothetical protein
MSREQGVPEGLHACDRLTQRNAVGRSIVVRVEGDLPRGSDGGRAGREAEALEDVPDGAGSLNCGEDPEPLAAPGAAEYVDGEDPCQQVGPG